ncbi:MAG: FHA domain-containing protein [Ruminococcus sp.]
MIYCTKCGAELNDDSNFCVFCGNSVNIEEFENEEMYEENTVLKQRCLNGHYFDARAYLFCPICGEMPVSEAPQAVQYEAEPVKPAREKNGFFRRQKQMNQQEAMMNPASVNPSVINPAAVNPAMMNPQAVNPAMMNPQAASSPYNQAAAMMQNMNSGNNARVDTGKTIAMFTDDFNTVPVVGWIVAVSGEMRGEAFKLVTGKNRIGRVSGNDIVIPNDSTISKKDHAIIVYEPKKKIFLLQAGNGNGLTYLNDEIVLEAKKLSNHDRIQFGSQEFLFVALCGEDFSWED